MKTLYKLAAGGMMLASAVAANAATLSTIDPATGNGDLLFFVTNAQQQLPRHTPRPMVSRRT
jgi:hypothetical protein